MLQEADLLRHSVVLHSVSATFEDFNKPRSLDISSRVYAVDGEWPAGGAWIACILPFLPGTQCKNWVQDAVRLGASACLYEPGAWRSSRRLGPSAR